MTRCDSGLGRARQILENGWLDYLERENLKFVSKSRSRRSKLTDGGLAATKTAATGC